jgi:RNA polymerase sigma-70 factor (ECF subfamily)
MTQYASPIASPRSASIPQEIEQESAWISSSQQGDARAFNRLVLKWEKRIYSVAFRMLRNREEAAEATQEVFLLAYRNIRRFRKDAKFSTWIYRIVLNHCLTRLKQRPPGTHLSLESESIPEKSAPQLRIEETQMGELMRREQKIRVLAALWRLTPDQQAVIELKFFQDLTFEEIAATLEVPLSTIKSRLYSGLEMLKSRLGAEA